LDAKWAELELSKEEPMRQRGRKSAASLSVVPINAIQRPNPPESMSESGKKLWRDAVNALRADWFQGAEPVLEVYVQTIELSRWLWEMITVADREGDEFAELVKLHCHVSALIANLATKLRLTPQSSRDARIPKLVPVGPKPWQLGTSQHFDNDEPRRFDDEPDEPEGPPAA
jgi:hypothetical protein